MQPSAEERPNIERINSEVTPHQMRVAVAQLGFRMHYAVPIILNKAGLLERLYTDLYLGKWPWRQIAGSHLSKYLPKKAKILFGRRADLPSEKVWAFQQFGLTFLWRSQRAHSSDKWRINTWAGEEFNRLIINEGLGGANCIYGFPGQCMGLFRYAHRLGIRCVLDQCLAPTPIQNRLVRLEYDRWPDWEAPPSMEHTEARSQRRLMQLWELADLILCPSVFVRRGLEEMGVPPDKCKVVPYGVDGQSLPARLEHRDHDGPVRILFVGQVRLLKGIPYLLDAMRQFTPSEAVCRLVGPITVARDKLEEYAPPNVSICGPVARNKVREYYEWADVFCLPTLCEGSATVIYEALMHDLPVITTPNSGSIIPETNSHHVIVPIRNANAIAEAIRKLGRHRHDGLNDAEPSNLAARASLEAYSERLLNALLSLDALDVTRIR